jgi:superfamily II RNA helicase
VLNGPYNGPECSAMKFPYECDDFQKHSFNCIDNDENVLVTAHTGSGKTLVALYAISHFTKKGSKVVYTSPIKALSNQKYKEFREIFPEMSIGLMTGDNKINPDAQCVIMTTEILRNALYDIDDTKRKDDYFEDNFIDSIGCVIFDEVHYINDVDRGRVWEETIILLNPKITLVMLSATIDRAEQFANWIGSNKGKVVNLISTTKRVIPLEHHIFVSGKLYKILDRNEKFIDENFDMAKSVHTKLEKERKKSGGTYMLDSLVAYLKENNLLQTIFFSFSRKNCEKYAKQVRTGLLTPQELSEMDLLYHRYMHAYEKEYQHIPQFHSIKQLMFKGISFHHSGLLPILKEIVEILFQKGFIKILFATETFAVGVNMPARTIVFTEIEKFTNRGRRLLETAEYKQMAGRAGRRGLDTSGTVILLPLYNFPFKDEFKGIMLGKVPHIQSRFFINYSFILKIIQSNSNNMNDFVERSLFKLDSDSMIKYDEVEIEQLKKEISLIDVNFDDETMTFIDEITKFDSLEEDYSKNGISLNPKQQKERKATRERLSANKPMMERYKKYKRYNELQKQLDDKLYYLESTKNYVDNESNKLKNILMELGYVQKSDKTSNELTHDDVTIKGVLGGQINECNPIILTEMIVRGVFDDLTAPEICALLAIFIDDIGSDDRLSIGNVKCSMRVSQKLKEINGIIDEIIDIEDEYGIDNVNYGFWDLFYDYVDIAYEWASGGNIQEILRSMDTYEGNFIRNMLKINNLAHDIACLTKISGNIGILPEFEKIQDLIVRDIVTVSSLYLKN